MRMVVSYTLARVIPTHDKDVYEQVSALDEVKGVVLSYGVYDMMITIETENIEELDNLVFNEIRKELFLVDYFPDGFLILVIVVSPAADT
jgi:DNA-binding Lrp family transcriptional regulator